MASPKYRVQVRLSRDGLIPADDAVNVWHFEADDDPVKDDRTHWDELATGLISRVQTFYQAIDEIFSSTMTGNGRISLYDMEDPLESPPRQEATFTYTPAETALPGEVALCLSMKATPGPGVNAARTRGRIYLGPLATNIGSATAGSPDVRPSSGIRTLIMNQAVIMARGVPGAARLAVYSPTTRAQGGTLSEALADVGVLWMDDAFDTQRRRGAAATSRRTEVLTG